MIPLVEQIRESTKVNYARIVEETKTNLIRTWASDIQLAVSNSAQNYIKIITKKYMISMPSFKVAIEAIILASEAYYKAGYAVVVRYYNKKNKCPDEIIISWPEDMPKESYKVVYGMA